MAEAAAVAAENNDHRICCFERCLFVQNLLLLLLSLLPGCPSSRVLLLLLTARCLNECIKNLKSQQKICSEHEQEYSLSILLVVLVVGIVVRARAEM